MPKPPSDSLFRLIQSLSSSEKRLITNFLSAEGKGGDNLHLSLYQMYTEMEEFDPEQEKKVAQEDKGKFAVRKNYLFNIILRRLDEAVEVDTYVGTIERHIRFARILLARDLLREAIQQIEKAEKLSEESELFSYLFTILHLKRRTYLNMLPYDKYQEESERIFERRAAVVDAMSNYEHVKTEYSRYKLLLVNRGSGSISDDDLAEIIRIRNSELFSDPVNCKTRMALIYFHDLRAHHAVFINDDYEAGYQEYNDLIKVIETVPDYIDQNIYDYLFFATKLVYYGMHLNRFEEVEDTYEELKRLYESHDYDNYPFIRSHISQYFLHIEVIAMFKYHAYERIVKWDPIISDDIEKNSKYYQEESLLVTASNVGMAWLANGNSKKAMQWFLRIVDGKHTLRQDIQNSTRIHLLLTLIDQDEINLFDKYHRSFLRSKKVSEPMSDVELGIVKDLRSVIDNAMDEEEFKNALNAVASSILDAMKNDSKVNNSNTRLVLYWLRAKLDDATVGAVMQKFSDQTIIQSF